MIIIENKQNKLFNFVPINEMKLTTILGFFSKFFTSL